MQLLPIYILLVSLPLGIAMQGFLTVIAVGILIYSSRESPCRTDSSVKTPMIIGLCFLAWGVFTDFANPKVTPQWSQSVGYLSWAILPWLLGRVKMIWSKEIFEKISLFLAIVVGIWGFVIVSQVLFGWRISGIEVVRDLPRSRGFYSHPLTLAYVALFFIPLAIKWPMVSPKSLKAYVFSAGILGAVVCTYSRMVLALTGILIFWNTLTTKTKWRPWLLAAAVTSSTLLFVTDNRLTGRFKNMLTEKGEDRLSHYPDDRLAFWHAHWLMIKERPMLGHGGSMDTEFRKPYYNRLGLADFKRPYEAHNSYIQILARRGVIGLMIYLSWLIWLARTIWKQPKSVTRSILAQTYIAFILACITQNGFQDSEVRFGLSLFAAIVLIMQNGLTTSPLVRADSSGMKKINFLGEIKQL